MSLAVALTVLALYIAGACLTAWQNRRWDRQ